MCVITSLPQRYHDLAKKQPCPVQVLVFVETLRYESANRRVLIAVDLIVRNQAAEDITLHVTHVDSVIAWLATADWLVPEGPGVDDRMRWMGRVYGAHWNIDPQRRVLTYSDPIQGNLPSEAESKVIEAHALSFWKDNGTYDLGRWKPKHMDDQPQPGYGTFRMHPLPADDRGPNERRPFSTFCLGPIAADSCVFARMTLLIEGAAYGRIVQPEQDCAFSVVSSTKVKQQIVAGLRAFQQDPGFRTYADWFSREIEGGILEPQRHHIVLVQAGIADKDSHPDNRIVEFRPASSSISELYIPDDEARQKVLWFHAWSSDFRLILRYGKTQQHPSREDFGRPLPQEVGVRREFT